MKHKTEFTALLVLAVLLGSSAGLWAQADQDKAAARRSAKLHKVCQAMSGLQSLAYTTSRRLTNDPMAARFQGRGQGKSKAARTSGTWVRDLLFVKLGEDDEVVFHGRRMIARDDDQEWTLRRTRLANGRQLPFALDPGVLFANLSNMNYDVTHSEVGTADGKPVETYSLTIRGDNARTLLWSGAIPDNQGLASTGATIVRAFGMGGGIARPRLNVSIDLAVTFDPATRMVLKIKGRSFTQGNNRMMGGRVILGGAGQPFDEEEEEEDEAEAPKEGSYVDGLPVRPKKEVKKATVVEFTYLFKNHDNAAPGSLDNRARNLLGLPSAK